MLEVCRHCSGLFDELDKTEGNISCPSCDELIRECVEEEKKRWFREEMARAGYPPRKYYTVDDY